MNQDKTSFDYLISGKNYLDYFEFIINLLENINKGMSFLVDQKVKRQIKEQERQSQKLKRKQAKRKQLRAAITSDEYYEILEMAKDKSMYKDSIVQARVIIALIIMYQTGLRISNLLLLKKKNLNEWLDQGETEISIIKGGPSRKLIYISKDGIDDLINHKNYLNYLLENRSIDSFVFFAQKNPEIPVNRANFDKQVNAVLQKASLKFKKNIRSHSMRATFVTDLLNAEISLEKVKEIVGHQSIVTTDKYRRSSFSKKKNKSILGKLQKIRNLPRNSFK